MPRYEITSPDGRRFEITAPEGASRDDVLAFVQQQTTPQDKRGTLERIGQGIEDPFAGTAQLLTKGLDTIGATGAVDKFMQWYNPELTPSAGGGTDKYIREREAAIEASRGGDTSVDWWRMLGSMISPMNLAPAGGLARGAAAATKLGNIGRAVGSGFSMGALGAAEQPVISENYWTTKLTDTLFGGTLGALIGGGTGVASSGVRALGEFIAREYPNSVTTQSVQAIARRIAQDAKAEGLQAKDVIELVSEANAMGKPATVSDMAGEGTQGLAGYLFRQPGGERAGKQFDSRNVIRQALRERDKGAAERINRDVETYMFGGPTMYQANEALTKARSASARPFYEEMEKTIVQPSERLNQFMGDPVVQEGLKRGLELERIRALTEGRTFDPQAALKEPTLSLLDMAKQGLDSMIDDESEELTRSLSKKGVVLVGLRDAFLEFVDSIDSKGVYAKARALWEGPSAAKDAIKFGNTVFNRSPEENAAKFAKLSPANQEFARLGVADKLKERIKKAGLSSDESRAVTKNDWTKDQLRPFFGNQEDFDNFIKAITIEQKMFDTGRAIMGGSQTAARVAEDMSTQNQQMSNAATLAHQLASRNWLAGLQLLMKMRDLGLKDNPVLNEQIARDLFSGAGPVTGKWYPKGQLAERLKGSKAKRYALPEVDPLLPLANAVNTLGSPLPLGVGAFVGQVNK